MTATKQVFISYRRDHDDALAGRIRDRMRESMPDWNVFLDVNSIRAGVDFRKAIDEQLAKSSVFLPLIGKRWLEEIDARLEGEDHVRYEIKSALERQETLKIIPLLVNDARMPGLQALPGDIARLASLNAARIGREDFDGGFARLVKEITGRDIAKRRPLVTIAANIAKGVIAGAVLGFVALIVHYHATGMSASEWIGDDGAALFLPACATIGGLVWYWYSSRAR
jgi:hypothetical protein